MNIELPELDYKAWVQSKATLHLTCQIIGKIKMAYHPKLNQWWHVTLHLTPSGISTLNVPYNGRSFEIELNVFDLKLYVRSSKGQIKEVTLADKSIADIYDELTTALKSMDFKKSILARPYDNPHSTIAFAQDSEHRHWDHTAIKNYWRILLFVDECFKLFAGQSFYKTSPAHLFWHSFDYAVTRFSGNKVTLSTVGGRRSDVEAYSHEVVSFGFWPGDPKVEFPAFYSYTAPEREGIAQSSLQPEQAWWQDLGASHMALLKYEDLRKADDPRATLLTFMQSANNAGCSNAQWKDPHEIETTDFWNELDRKFPGTKGRENRI